MKILKTELRVVNWQRGCARLFASLVLSWLIAPLNEAHAQWTEQTISLRPGWNAVFIEVQPEPAECDTVFAGLPVESVWRWNRRFSPIQFVQDPATLTPAASDWLVFLPSTHPLASQRTLYTISGGRPYLIRLRDNAASVNWTVRGPATLRAPDWLTDSLNFVGFSLAAGATPSFANFFSGSDSHRNGPIYRLSAAGYWTAVPPATPMQPAEAFWIRTEGQSDYPGPVALQLEQSTGLDFGGVLQEQTLRIQNRSAQALSMTLSQLSSQDPASPAAPPLAGPVPLSYWSAGANVAQAGWRPLPAALTISNVPAGETRTLRLAVRRADMTPSAGVAGATYQSVLEVKDSAGLSRQLVPVTSRGLRSLSVAAMGQVAQSQAPALRPGLWIGHAVIDKVSQPSDASPNEPKPTASPFQFRLILHLNEQGELRLLQKVVQMWKPGTYKQDPSNPTQRIVDQPGRFVLITDDALLGNFSGATLRDGVPAGRRFSTAAFSFRAPIVMTPQFGGKWQCQVDLGYDEPLNPFKHVHHPDHDNWDRRYEVKLVAGRESFDVSRTLSLEFTANDPENLTLAGWGDNQIGGIYRETIAGLNRQPLSIQGTFRLQLASRETRLNDRP